MIQCYQYLLYLILYTSIQYDIVSYDTIQNGVQLYVIWYKMVPYNIIIQYDILSRYDLVSNMILFQNM